MSEDVSNASSNLIIISVRIFVPRPLEDQKSMYVF